MNQTSAPGMRRVATAAGTLVAFSVRRRGIVFLVVGLLAFFGLAAFVRLPSDLPPGIRPPVVAVTVSDPGIPAAVMELRVTNILETALRPVPQLARMVSSTTEGVARVDLELAPGSDAVSALRDVRARLEDATAALPLTVDPPQVTLPEPLPVMDLVIVSGERSPPALRSWAEEVLAKQLLALPNVETVRVEGGGEREIRVMPDQRRLAGAGLSLSELIRAVRAAGSSPAEHSVGRPTRLTSAAALAALPLRLPNGESMALSEVARVEDHVNLESLRVRRGGLEGIRIQVLRQAGVRARAVAERVAAHLAWMRANGLIPADVEMTVVHDAAVQVRASLRASGILFATGLSLALALLMLLLRGARRIFAVASTVPLAIGAGAIVLYVTGATLDALTLSGLGLGALLAVGFGIRACDQHVAGQRAARAPQYALAGMLFAGILLVTTAVFALAGGLVGQLYRGFFFALTSSLLAALLLSASWVPAIMASPMGPRRGPRAKDGAFADLRKTPAAATVRIAPLFRSALARRRASPAFRMIALLYLAAAAVVFWTAVRHATGPSGTETGAVLELTVPERDAAQRVDDVERRIREAGLAKNIYSVVRLLPSTPEAPRYVVVRMIMDLRGGGAPEFLRRLDAQLERAGTPATLQFRDADGTARLLRVEVQGADLKELAALGESVASRLTRLPGLESPHESARDVIRDFAVHVDAARAEELGIDVTEAERAFRIARTAPVVSELSDGERRYAVRVFLPQEEGQASAGRVLLAGELRDRPAVYLRDIAALEPASWPALIRHDQGVRSVEVTAALTGERPGAAVLSGARESLQDLRLPPGYSLRAVEPGETRAAGAIPAVALALAVAAVLLWFLHASPRGLLPLFPAAPVLLGTIGLVPWPGAAGVAPGIWPALILLIAYSAGGWLLAVGTGQRGRKGFADEAGSALSAHAVSTLSVMAGALPLWLMPQSTYVQQSSGLALAIGLPICLVGTILGLGWFGNAGLSVDAGQGSRTRSK